MPKWLPKKCRVCNKKAADGWAISRRGLCEPCGLKAVERAVTSMMTKRGAPYRKYRAAIKEREAGAGRPGVGGSRSRSA